MTDSDAPWPGPSVTVRAWGCGRVRLAWARRGRGGPGAFACSRMTRSNSAGPMPPAPSQSWPLRVMVLKSASVMCSFGWNGCPTPSGPPHRVSRPASAPASVALAWDGPMHASGWGSSRPRHPPLSRRAREASPTRSRGSGRAVALLSQPRPSLCCRCNDGPPCASFSCAAANGEAPPPRRRLRGGSPASPLPVQASWLPATPESRNEPLGPPRLRRECAARTEMRRSGCPAPPFPTGTLSRSLPAWLGFSLSFPFDSLHSVFYHSSSLLLPCQL